MRKLRLTKAELTQLVTGKARLGTWLQSAEQSASRTYTLKSRKQSYRCFSCLLKLSFPVEGSVYLLSYISALSEEMQNKCQKL